MFLDALKEIGLESQWVRNETAINALDNNDNDWNTTDDDSSASDIEEEANDNADNNESDSNMESSDEVTEEQSSINWKILSSGSEDNEN